MPPSTPRTPRRWLLASTLVTLVLVATALIVCGIAFVSASELARGGGDGARIPRSFLELPLFTGFRNGDRFGVHPEWGLLVMLAVPFVSGSVVAAVGLLRARARR